MWHMRWRIVREMDLLSTLALGSSTEISPQAALQRLARKVEQLAAEVDLAPGEPRPLDVFLCVRLIELPSPTVSGSDASRAPSPSPTEEQVLPGVH